MAVDDHSVLAGNPPANGPEVEPWSRRFRVEPGTNGVRIEIDRSGGDTVSAVLAWPHAKMLALCLEAGVLGQEQRSGARVNLHPEDAASLLLLRAQLLTPESDCVN